MATKFTGRGYINIPTFGRVPSEKGSTLKLGGVTKEAVKTDSGVQGFREGEPVPASMEMSINHHANISVTALRDFVGNIDFETDTGVSFKLIGAECIEPPDLSGGMISITYEAIRCEEQR